jgi:hypothetical protein
MEVFRGEQAVQKGAGQGSLYEGILSNQIVPHFSTVFQGQMASHHEFSKVPSPFPCQVVYRRSVSELRSYPAKFS